MFRGTSRPCGRRLDVGLELRHLRVGGLERLELEQHVHPVEGLLGGVLGEQPGVVVGRVGDQSLVAAALEGGEEPDVVGGLHDGDDGVRCLAVVAGEDLLHVRGPVARDGGAGHGGLGVGDREPGAGEALLEGADAELAGVAVVGDDRDRLAPGSAQDLADALGPGLVDGAAGGGDQAAVEAVDVLGSAEGGQGAPSEGGDLLLLQEVGAGEGHRAHGGDGEDLVLLDEFAGGRQVLGGVLAVVLGAEVVDPASVDPALGVGPEVAGPGPEVRVLLAVAAGTGHRHDPADLDRFGGHPAGGAGRVPGFARGGAVGGGGVAGGYEREGRRRGGQGADRSQHVGDPLRLESPHSVRDLTDRQYC